MMKTMKKKFNIYLRGVFNVILFVAVIIGIPLGIISAYRRNSALDVGTMLFANVGVSMPVFWLGLNIGAALLVRALVEAIPRVQAYIAGAIAHAPDLGGGHGPMAHFWEG